MKKFILFFASLLFGLVIFSWIIKKIGWEETERVISSLNLWQVIIILALTLISALVSVWKWRELLRIEGIIISFPSLIRYYLGGFSVSFFLPQIVLGGEVLRGYLLKEKSSVPGIKGIASALTDRILETTIFLIVIFIGAFYLFFKIGFHPTKLTIIIGTILLFLVLITILFYFKGFKRESVVRFIVGGDPKKLLEIEKEMFKFLKPKKLLMLKIFILNILKVFTMFLRAWFLVSFLGKNIGVMPTMTILGFSYIAMLMPITAAIGSHEAAQLFVFNSLGLGVNAGTAFTMVIRGADFIIALIGAIIIFRLGITLVKNNLYKKIDSFANHYEV